MIQTLRSRSHPAAPPPPGVPPPDFLSNTGEVEPSQIQIGWIYHDDLERFRGTSADDEALNFHQNSDSKAEHRFLIIHVGLDRLKVWNTNIDIEYAIDTLKLKIFTNIEEYNIDVYIHEYGARPGLVSCPLSALADSMTLQLYSCIDTLPRP